MPATPKYYLDAASLKKIPKTLKLFHKKVVFKRKKRKFKQGLAAKQILFQGLTEAGRGGF